METNDGMDNSFFRRSIDSARSHRWLTVYEIITLLTPGPSMIMTITSKPPGSPPPSGTLLLFDRTLTRDYKQDGHEWVKKTNSKKVREDHVKLRYEGNYRVAGTYVHSSKTPTLHRRCYHLIEEGGMSVRKLQESGKQSLVLVHYLDTAEASSSRALDAIGHQAREDGGQTYESESGSDSRNSSKRPRSSQMTAPASMANQALGSVSNVGTYPKTISAPPGGISEGPFWNAESQIRIVPSNMMNNSSVDAHPNRPSLSNKVGPSEPEKKDLSRLVDVTPSKGFLGDDVQIVFSLSNANHDFASYNYVAQEYATFSSVYLESQSYVRVAACCLVPVRKITPYSFKCDNLPNNLTSPGSWRVILLRVVLSANSNPFSSSFSLEPHAAALIERLLNVEAGVIEDRFRQEGESFVRLRIQDQGTDGWVEAVSMFGPKDFLIISPFQRTIQNNGQLTPFQGGSLYHPM